MTIELRIAHGNAMSLHCHNAIPNTELGASYRSTSLRMESRDVAMVAIVVIGGYPFTTIRQVNGADYNGRAIMFDG